MQERMRFACHASDRRTGACIEVADRGPGFTEEERKRLFERFYQVDSENAGEGLGLGLNIVSGFVGCMGGSVEVRSREGGGSVFSVKLPGGGETAREGC
jgi:signal transduction histidine kinase